MRIETVGVYGIDESIVASKYPMATDVSELTNEITSTQIALGTSEIGSGHDNYLNGITVIFDLTCSIKMWTEAQRYHFLNFISSQSTMHRITQLDLRSHCNKYVWEMTIVSLEASVARYNALEDKSSIAAHEIYLEILYNVPTGFELTARMTTNYRQLKTMVSQRKNHRLPEWKYFTSWCMTLPKFSTLTQR